MNLWLSQNRCCWLPLAIFCLLSLIFNLCDFNRVSAKQQIIFEERPPSWRQDAEIVDLCFVNAKVGWAVGAHGVILKTVDGGENWREISQAGPTLDKSFSLRQKMENLQAGRRTSTSGMTHDPARNRKISCRFQSVHFVDERNGWIAGGYHLPYIDRSRAVILKTDNGGQTWKAIDGLMLPQLRKVHFHNESSGWAIGDTGNLYSSGFYQTSDGGQTWRSDSQARSAGWIDAAESHHGICMIDVFGRLGLWKNSRHQLSVMINLTSEKQEPAFHDLLMLDQKNGVAVGDHGTIVRTSDGGKSWQALNLKNAHPKLAHVTLNTVALNGNVLWFAGDPGGQLFALNLSDGTIESRPIPAATQINRIEFVDQKRGFAVGDQGVILLTQDGGSSWKQVRGEQKESAMLIVCESSLDIPFSLLAKYALENNRICHAVILQSSWVEFERARQAMSRLGLSSCKLLKIENVASSGIRDKIKTPAANQCLLDRLVQQIRIQRPRVVVAVPAADPVIPVGQLVDQAIQKASVPSAGQTHSLQLATHLVQRKLTVDPFGPISVSSNQTLPQSGLTMADAVALSRAIVGKSILPKAAERYQVRYLNGPRNLKNTDVLYGIASISKITRNSKIRTNANLTKIRKMTARNRRLQELLAFEIHGLDDIQVWKRQVDQELVAWEPAIAATWLAQLFEGYHQAGKMELAAQTAQRLGTRWSDSPYALPALVWLASHYASEEQGTHLIQLGIKTGRFDKRKDHPDQTVESNPYASRIQVKLENGITKTSWKNDQSIAKEKIKPVKPAAFESPASSNPKVSESELTRLNRPELIRQRIRLASRFLSAVGQFDPDLATSPWYQWMEIQLSRRSGTPVFSLKNRLKNLSKVDRQNLAKSQSDLLSNKRWAILAKQELNQVDGVFVNLSTEPVQATGSINVRPECPSVDQPPHLDGLLTERFWRSRNAPDHQVKFARDDDFLYLSVRCTKIKGANYQWKATPRPTDADLERRDRVEILLDLDRDFRHAYRFTVDHRGWVNDACQHNQSWNPDWYVAQDESDNEWRIEAAIPWDELASLPFDPKEPWAVSVRRLTAPVVSEESAPLTIQPQANRPFDWLTFSTEASLKPAANRLPLGK